MLRTTQARRSRSVSHAQIHPSKINGNWLRERSPGTGAWFFRRQICKFVAPLLPSSTTWLLKLSKGSTMWTRHLLCEREMQNLDIQISGFLLHCLVDQITKIAVVFYRDRDIRQTREERTADFEERLGEVMRQGQKELQETRTKLKKELARVRFPLRNCGAAAVGEIKTKIWFYQTSW